MKTKKLLLSLLTTWVVVTGLSAKNTIVTFRSNKEITVRVNKPIDGVYNFYYNTDRMDLKPNISIGYELGIHDCCSIRCELSSGLFFYVLLQEGDHLEISNMGNQIIFKGDNAAGNQYLFENYCMKGLGEYFPKVDSIFKKNISNKVDYNAISKTFHQYIVPSYTKDIEALQKEKKITSAFASDMLQNLYFAYSSIYFYHYQKLYSGKFINYKPSVLDSTQIVNEIDRLYSLTQWKVNPLKCYYASMENYYSFKYRSLDQMSKNKLLAGHDKETFGEYAGYLLAPDTLQSALFGSLLISNLQNKETYFDQELMLKYLSEKFPNSEYLPIIKGLMGRQQLNTTNKTGTEESAVIIGRSIRSLKELMQVEGIKGKCAYIDLWATYCMPCKFQFQYNIDLHKLLNSYNNLVTVYISIDDEKDEPMWRNQIQYYHLFGYNLIASKELKNDIQQRLLKGAPLLVPRYLLVDENANSLNNNLPRPQALLILKEELDKTLK